MISSASNTYARRSIESLRSGVPNAHSVQALGIEEPEIMRAFEERLEALTRREGPISGFLIEGDFGTGKSHILRYLENLSSKRKLATSSVTVSKETPLGDLASVFRSAILNLTYPDGRLAGSLVEVFDRLDTDSAPYARFYKSVCEGSLGLNPVFEASMLLYDRYRGNPEIVEQLVEFWDGGPPQVTFWKRLLKELDAAPKIKSTYLPDLAIQRFCFVSLALRAAGFTGWFLAVDEMELLAKLTLFGRTKAYIAIDRLFNLGTNSTEDFDCVLTNVIAVGAITTDLIGELIHTRGERALLEHHFRLPQSMINAALSGLNSLVDPRWRHMIRSEVNLKTKWDTVRQLYLTAYSADIKSGGQLGDYDASLERRNMRQNIRSWIWAWDLKRLDPNYESEIVADSLSYDLSEDEDIELSDDEASFESAV